MAVDKRWSKNRAPHRTLYSGSRGLDVAQLQHGLNRRAEARAEFGYKPVEADGDFGAKTRSLWVEMSIALGLNHRKCTAGNQSLMRSPAKRTAPMKAKERDWTKHQRAALARRKAHHGHGDGAKAVQFMLDRAGWKESPYGSNDSTFLRHWRQELHMDWMRGQPWCGFAILAAYHYAAHKNLPQDTVSTVAIANRARRGDGFRQVSVHDIQEGDLIVFNFGSGGPKHVGLARGPMRNGVIPTVEGNTSSGNGGSQSNGGGIYVRSRSVGLVHTVARPK